MTISKTLQAALAALAIAAVSTGANAAPAPDAAGYVLRTVRSTNGKDPFVRIVKVPAGPASARAEDCPKTKDLAAMRAKCARMMGSASTPKG